MKTPISNVITALTLLALGATVCAAGIYVGHTDDAPGAGMLGILLLLGAVVLAFRTLRKS